MQLGYTSYMTITEELERIASQQREAPAIRAALVARARAEGMTWREIADILGMTQHGLIKAQRAQGADKGASRS